MSNGPFKALHVIAENQIRRLIEEGAFDNLPGAGKPIPDLDQPYDENWWLKSFLKREKLSVAPETLTLRVVIEREIETLWNLDDEAAVRQAVVKINLKIRRMNSTAHAGPMTVLAAMDAEEVLARWREKK